MMRSMMPRIPKRGITKPLNGHQDLLDLRLAQQLKEAFLQEMANAL
jgi:hypothetical protein